MAYLRDFEYDVFISYSMTNDELSLDGQPWVKQFETELASKLRNKLSANGKDICIFYSGRDLKPGEDIRSCTDIVKKSGILLIIGSPRYVADPWPIKELTAFQETAGGKNARTFIAEIETLGARQTYPDGIDQILRSEFWTMTDKGNAQTFERTEGAFNSRLTDLAQSIVTRLYQLNDVPTPPKRQPNPDYKTVLIAQTTDDLIDDAEQVRTSLEQFDIAVVTVQSISQAGPDFVRAFTDHAKVAGIVVQLFGPHSGRRPADLPDGYLKTQAEIVSAMPETELIQWRSVVDLATVKDDQHRALLEGPKVQCTSLTDFISEVRERATQPPPRAPTPDEGRFIFVNSDMIDDLRATEIFKKCKAEKRAVIKPVHGSDSIEQWKENYESSGKVVLVHEQSGPGWVASQLRLYAKTTAKLEVKPDVRVIYLGPPEKREDDMPFFHPDFEMISAPDGDLDPLFRKLL
jgi:hypothetical protein